MKPMRFYVPPDGSIRDVLAYIASASPPFTVTFQAGEKRTLSQNALIHKWYDEIANHYGDRDAAQVKAECHVEFGLPIRLRDEAFDWVWQKSGAKLPYDKQLALFQRGTFAMTSEMTTAELTEYMDAVSRHYRAEGVMLTDPEGRA